MLCAIIITKNAQETLGRTLASLGFCNEIIVVDDESSDKTVSIARAFGAKVVCQVLANDFARQRNFALARASCQWVLFVDADEVVTDQLATEIREAIMAGSSAGAYRIRREDVFWGRRLRFGETGNFFDVRLAKKGVGEWQRRVHEQWETSGSVGKLKNPLVHFAHQNLNGFIKKLNFYSDLDAGAFLEAGRRFSVFELFWKPGAKFFLNYCLRGGFLDGFAGFVMAFMMSLNSFVVRVKMYDHSNLVQAQGHGEPRET